jgi:hypothetical protein
MRADSFRLLEALKERASSQAVGRPSLIGEVHFLKTKFNGCGLLIASFNDVRHFLNIAILSAGSND